MHGPEGRKADVRLPGKGNSNTHGARPVHLIITMMKWIRTKYRFAVLADVAGVVGVEDALADEGARHRVCQRRAPAWSP